MNRRMWIWFWVLLLCGMVISCQEATQKPVPVDNAKLKESLEKANRYLINDEEEDIQNYISRHQLNMVSTGTGLRYQIIKEGEGARVLPGQTVTLEYVLYNVMGDEIYSSDNVAKVIIPSHLGYGLLGDQKSIPERSTLIYTIRVLKVEI